MEYPNTALSVSVAVSPDDINNLSRARGVVALAQAFVVDSALMAQEAADQLREWAATKVGIKRAKDGFVENAKKIITHANETFDPALKEIEKADGILRGTLLAYQDEQKRLAAESQRAADDRARAERQRAEQDAAAARAAADEKARQHAAEAARLRAAARDAEGAAAARLAAQAAKATEKAVAAIETGEATANAAILGAASTAEVVEGPAKIEGFGSRANWIAEWDAPESEIKEKIVAAICAGRTDLYALLTIDASASNKLAKALKGAFNVPGMRAVNRPIATVRK